MSFFSYDKLSPELSTLDSIIDVGQGIINTKNYLKLQILVFYNNLRIGQDSEFAQF